MEAEEASRARGFVTLTRIRRYARTRAPCEKSSDDEEQVFGLYTGKTECSCCVRGSVNNINSKTRNNSSNYDNDGISTSNTTATATSTTTMLIPTSTETKNSDIIDIINEQNITETHYFINNETPLHHS